MFETAAARAACLQLYATAAGRGLVAWFCGRRPEFRLRGRHALVVGPAPEPSDVPHPTPTPPPAGPAALPRRPLHPDPRYLLPLALAEPAAHPPPFADPLRRVVQVLGESLACSGREEERVQRD